MFEPHFVHVQVNVIVAAHSPNGIHYEYAEYSNNTQQPWY